MPKPKVPKIFISYSRKDIEYAREIMHRLQAAAHAQVWIDYDTMTAGDVIAESIKDAMKRVDYYLILISENSNSSIWVKREISFAFQLASEKNLAIIPFLIERVDVPLEFKGLIYIDGTTSFKDGLEKLINFFERQSTKVRELVEWREIGNFKAESPRPQPTKCHDTLGRLELGDLRFELSARLTLKDIRVLWFDIFNTKMEDDVFSQDRATCCLELLDRSSGQDLLTKLIIINKVCRNYPTITKGL